MSRHEINQAIVHSGLKILLEEHTYTQVEVFQKLKSLEVNISKSTISNLWKGKANIGPAVFKEAAKGIAEILQVEQCLVFEEKNKSFVRLPDCQGRTIALVKDRSSNPVQNTSPYILHDGRFGVTEKVAFFQKAKAEVMEVGIRLRNFRNYFEDRTDGAFLDPLRSILDRGVHFKSYVLDPDGNMARRYFADRAVVQPLEKKAFAESQDILTELKFQFRKLNKEGFLGKMELHTYDHFPYYHATVIDGDTEQAELLMASYLYGVTRANTPVVQVKKRANKKLFKRYWQSIKAITSNQSKQLL